MIDLIGLLLRIILFSFGKCECRLTIELTHAGHKPVNREAELKAPSGVVCSDLVSPLFHLVSSSQRKVRRNCSTAEPRRQSRGGACRNSNTQHDSCRAARPEITGERKRQSKAYTANRPSKGMLALQSQEESSRFSVWSGIVVCSPCRACWANDQAHAQPPAESVERKGDNR